MKIKQKALLLALAAGLVAQTAMANPIDAFYHSDSPINGAYKNNPWLYMEETFVTRPDELCTSLVAKIINGCAPVVGSVPGIALGSHTIKAGLKKVISEDSYDNNYNNYKKDLDYYHKKLTKYNEEMQQQQQHQSRQETENYTESYWRNTDRSSRSSHRETKTLTRPQSPQPPSHPNTIGYTRLALQGILSTALLAGGPIVTYKLTKYFLEKYINYKALQDFVENWEMNKKNVPTEFHDSFDEIYSNYQEQGSKYLKNISTDSIKKIKRMIYEKYPEKYAHRIRAFDTPKSLFEQIQEAFLLPAIALGTVGGIALLAGAFKNVVEGLAYFPKVNFIESPTK